MKDSPNENGRSAATYLPKEETTLSFPVDKTVLLLIDPVNDFLSEGGAGWELTKTTVKLNNVVDKIKAVADAARAKGIPVLFGPMAYTEEDYAHHQLHRRSGINRLMFENKMFLAGSWGADFHPDLQPHDGDIILLPHKSLDVMETDLRDYLKAHAITHLVIAGMAANLCCESTGRHAMEAGYDVTFISDAIGAAGVMEYEAAININFPLIANAVIKTDDFIKALEANDSFLKDIQKGDSVRGSDHGEIGTIEKVMMPNDETDGYILVPRGMIFKTDTYIPMDAVIKRSGTEVFVNIPKIMVDKMPWSEPPTQLSQQEKRGPTADSVERLYGSRSPSVADQGVGHEIH